MSMHDPLADMLTRIRNALLVGKTSISMPNSKLKVAVCGVLREEGFIGDFKVSEDAKPELHVDLKYAEDGEPAIVEIQRKSRPGLRVYVTASDIPQVRSGLGVAILSTAQGVMTNRKARQAGIGGEVLCTVF